MVISWKFDVYFNIQGFIKTIRVWPKHKQRLSTINKSFEIKPYKLEIALIKPVQKDQFQSNAKQENSAVKSQNKVSKYIVTMK